MIEEKYYNAIVDVASSDDAEAAVGKNYRVLEEFINLMDCGVNVGIINFVDYEKAQKLCGFMYGLQNTFMYDILGYLNSVEEEAFISIVGTVLDRVTKDIKQFEEKQIHGDRNIENV